MLLLFKALKSFYVEGEIIMASKPEKSKAPKPGRNSKPAKNSGASDGKPRSAVVKKQKGRSR
jgi:hypothetical protein